MNTAEDLFEGVALHERMPFAWEPAGLDNAVELDHANQEAARVLQAMSVFEEAPREHSSDPNQPGQDLLHLESKVDVLLSLVGMLIGHRQNGAAPHSLVLRAGSLEWSGPVVAQANPGDQGYAVLYPNPMLPLPLRLPASICGSLERSGSRWLLTRFEFLTPPVKSAMEKLVFRRHRRQVALSRGTGVFSETGLFRVPKK